MEILIIGIYILCMLFIFLFSLTQFHLTRKYIKSRKNVAPPLPLLPDQQLPFVTIQLPVYNELYVVERLLEVISELKYPADKLEIQVLDDSSDQTSQIITKKLEQITRVNHFRWLHLRRGVRDGFKAGALQFGLQSAKGEFLVVFDADFLPQSDFIRQMLPYFDHEKIGMVQARWGHLNEKYSLLTRLQAFGLNAHFSIEQTGRHVTGSFIDFNGTAGIWRKKCILDADGWHHDTLTEDLDLSYRAQLKGWQFRFVEDIVAPAELPVLVPAIKSQQYRWNKGAAETARKHLKQVLHARIKGVNKWHAFFHLFNSSVFLSLFIASMVSIPLLFVKASNPGLKLLFDLSSIFLLGFAAITYFYWVATQRFYPDKSISFYLKNYTLFMIFSMGLSFHNAIAVMEGFLGVKTPFIRTPKFNIKSTLDSWKGNVYIPHNLSWQTVFEGLLMLYFIFGILSGVYLNDYGLIIFHIMLALGFGGIFFITLKNTIYARNSRMG